MSVAVCGAARSRQHPRGWRRKLSEGQLAQVEAALEAGPKANGFPTEVWTLAQGWCRAPAGPRPHGPCRDWPDDVRLSEVLSWLVSRPACGKYTWRKPCCSAR